MPDPSPLVSIIIPTYNAERFIEEAVASAQNQLQGRVEIIIIDDGSTDSTPALIDRMASQDPRIRIEHQANAGPSAARNRGLRLANGEFVCFLDADDTVHAAKICRQLTAIERAGAGIAYSDYYTTDEDLVPETIVSTGLQMSTVAEQLPFQNVFPVHAALIRRQVIEQVGFLDESLRGAEDWDYWIRCASVTSIVHVPGALCSYRRHGAQSHNDRDVMRSSQQRVLRKNYPARSAERVTAMAGFYWGDAKYQYFHRHRLKAAVSLLRFLAWARTPSRARRVMRLGRFG